MHFETIGIKKFRNGLADRYNCYYYIYFPMGTKLNDLRKTETIMHTVVHWEYHTWKKGGPTQCANCQL